MGKILLISYYFDPPYKFGGGQRMSFFARFLSSNGFETDIISSAYTQINGKREITNKSPVFDILKRKYGFLRKYNPLPDAMLVWSVRTVNRVMKIHKNYDCIIVSSPPPSIIGVFVTKMHIRKKIIIDLRDSWFNGPHQEYGTVINRMIDEFMEKICLSKFNKIIAATKTIAKTIEHKYNKKVLTIYNMLDRNKVVNGSSKSAAKCIFYGGKIDRVRYNEQFFNVLQNEEDITLRFAGKDEYRVSTLKNVEYLGVLNRKEFMQEMLLCDVSLITINNYTKNPQEIFTSKIFEILLAKKKVLYVGPQCELSEFINKEKIGIAVTDNSIESIKSGLKAIFMNEYSINDELIEKYHYENVLSKIFLLF